ncbi:hypothetical protein EVAR_14661_1 [Eumeta japonica]|uniref:Uncharacterized protein n=1 Tax=Eumeta variegata TaxID=151549 RepID=A0A4C1U277_EUMVA|nr:hypothetical protein EVAR_14661_1 [Eumeta japonica]
MVLPTPLFVGVTLYFLDPSSPCSDGKGYDLWKDPGLRLILGTLECQSENARPSRVVRAIEFRTNNRAPVRAGRGAARIASAPALRPARAEPPVAAAAAGTCLFALPANKAPDSELKHPTLLFFVCEYAYEHERTGEGEAKQGKGGQLILPENTREIKRKPWTNFLVLYKIFMRDIEPIASDETVIAYARYNLFIRSESTADNYQKTGAVSTQGLSSLVERELSNEFSKAHVA